MRDDFHATMTPPARQAFGTPGPAERPCAHCGNGPAQICTACLTDLTARTMGGVARTGGPTPACALCEAQAAALCAICWIDALDRARQQARREGRRIPDFTDVALGHIGLPSDFLDKAGRYRRLSKEMQTITAQEAPGSQLAQLARTFRAALDRAADATASGHSAP